MHLICLLVLVLLLFSGKNVDLSSPSGTRGVGEDLSILWKNRFGPRCDTGLVKKLTSGKSTLKF